MQIIWRGQSFFQILTVPLKDVSVSLAIDPFSENLGLRVPQVSADILLITHDHSDHNNVKAVQGSPFLIDGPGEYEIKDVSIQGIPAFHDKSLGKERGRVTIYTIESEGLKVCHLADFGQKELFAEQIEDIGEVDILLIPVGGDYTIGSQEASKIIGQIEPKIVIPMHYQLPKLKVKLESLDKFLRALGEKASEPLPKLTIKEKDLPEEGMKTIILRAQ
ncbi:MAG: MBL fold metallo-hydrolase [Candidatus Nealsonbacteria bacterium]|nr:MBL fold metallo-hydrolase [Candidatus Nealsonbacteria bacterium]